MLTKQPVRTIVRHARREGDGWGSPEESMTLWAFSVSLRNAPQVHRAKFKLADTIERKLTAWNWRQYVNFDDRIEIVLQATDTSEETALFAGFVADVHWAFARQDDCTITCVSPAQRLLADQDYLLYGRYMQPKTGAVKLFTGLNLVFNAGGRPNMAPEVESVSGSPAGVPYFTGDDGVGAEFWTFEKIVTYLMYRYNGNAETAWLLNFDLPQSWQSDVPMSNVDVQGMSLWQALAHVAQLGGYDVYEEFSLEGGEIASLLKIVEKGKGTARTVKHQAPNADGTLAELDLAKTNLLAAQFAETVSSCQPAPVVAGGEKLYEITIPLQRAWNQTRLVVPAGYSVVLPSSNGGTSQMTTNEYCQRYVVGGSLFAQYADCGRLWDANTDEKYSQSPYNATIPDIADLADQDAGSWPKMAYKPYPCLSGVDVGANGQIAHAIEAFLEISFDSGTTWQQIHGFDILPDRLGVRLTMENLAGIVRDPVGTTTYDPYTYNLFSRLVSAPTTVKMQMTCTIAAPDRNMLIATPRASAGTTFPQGAFYDKGNLGQTRKKAESSIFGDELTPDETKDDDASQEADSTSSGGQDEGVVKKEPVSKALSGVAMRIQDAMASRYIEGSIPFEWLGETIGLTDTITQIEGINYQLGTQVGVASRYPRVVGIDYLLTPDTYSVQISLDTFRLAGVI